MKRKSESYCRIDASPVAGVLVTLLFLLAMMVPGPHFSPWGSVELPEARHSFPVPGALREDAMLVGISGSGDLYFRTRHISVNGLAGEISQSLQSGADRRVFLSVDRRVRYADVKPVLVATSSAGIENVALLTNNR